MVLIKAIADYVEGAGMHVIEVRRLGDDISPRKVTTFPTTLQLFSKKSYQQPLLIIHKVQQAPRSNKRWARFFVDLKSLPLGGDLGEAYKPTFTPQKKAVTHLNSIAYSP